jgi:uncharacterized protein (TIGR03437 family)
MNSFRFIAAIAAAVVSTLSAQTLQLVSGHGQVIQEQFLSTQPFKVRAVDAAGRPVPNVPITWSVSPTTAGTLITPSAQTNAEGEASVGLFASSNQPGVSFTPATITASSPQGVVQFALVISLSKGTGGNLVPLPFVQPVTPTQGSELRGTAGSILPGAVSVRVVAQGGISLGQPVPNVGLRVEPIDTSEGVTARCNAPGGVVITDQSGLATCDLLLGGTPGFVQMRAVVGEYWPNLRFDLTVAPSGTNCTFRINPLSQSFAAAGGSGAITVESNPGCAWNAASASPWISISSGTSGQGNGSVTYSVAANTAGQRTGSISIAGQTVTLTQAAAGTTGGASLAFSIGSSLPSATTTLAYSVGLNATGGTAPYRWTAAASLPAGLALNSSTGVISGIPTFAGTYSIPVTLTDASNASVNQTFTLLVTPFSVGSPVLIITTSSFAGGFVGVPYEQAVTTTGGCSNPFAGPPAITLASGALPPGLALQSLTGGGFGVAGTPTTGGVYTFALRASACTDATTREFSITVGGVTAGAEMTVAPAELVFSSTAGGVMRPADQAVSVATASTPTSFGVSVTTESGGNWLAISPATGQTPATLVAGIVNNAALAPGTYRGAIRIFSQASNSPVVVPVTLNVTAPATLALSTGTVRFEHTLGVLTNSEQVVGVTSSFAAPGGVAFTSVVGNNTSWLSVVPPSGQTPANVRLVANTAGLLPGTYDGFVSFAPVTNPNSIQTLHAILTVLPPPAQPNLPAITSVMNAASFVVGGVAPGEFVTIFGNNLSTGAPATFRLTAAGTLDSVLAGTRVLFNETAAPLIYVSPGQVSAIVPYGIANRTSTRITVEHNGLRSTSTEIAVAEAAPGIFTLGGATQGAILNQDGSVNGVQTAAAAGSIVSIYATGEGLLAPPGVEGSVAPAENLSRPILRVTVQIGGLDAEVLYAGSAPGLLVGMLQVNARVPDEVPRGASVPVTLTIGRNRSNAATMTIE